MKSSVLKSYSSNMKKVAKAAEREERMRVARAGKFKASLVDDPLKTDACLVDAYEAARCRDAS